MSPAIRHLRGGASDAADVAATCRSILRYLARYEREWGYRVSVPSWHFMGCRPPEEDGLCLVAGRVRLALSQLTKEGALERHGDGWRLRREAA